MAGNRLYQNIPQQIDIVKQFTENGVENDPSAAGGVGIKCQKIPSKNHFNSDINSTSTHSWMLKLDSTGDILYSYRTSINSMWFAKARISPSPSFYVTMNFTGQHRCIPQEDALYDHVEDYQGMLVEATGEYNSLVFEETEEDMDLIENSEAEVDVETGQTRGPQQRVTRVRRKIVRHQTTTEATINEAQPVVRLTTSPRSKRVYGVISTKEDSKDGQRIFGHGAFVTHVSDLNDRRLIINSIGEGGILVCSEGGDIENGDYLCSSTTPGIAMRQEDDLLHNYTVAKATQSYTFLNNTETKLIGATYHCG